MFFDPWYFLAIGPALLLAFIAQMMVKSAYANGNQIAARMSGFAAARQILDAAGLHHVGIEQVPGRMSDHYDPRDKVLRLSQEVYHGRSMSAVGIAAHEAGHAIQDARHYLPLVVRNAAVPAASFGSSGSMIMLMLGFVMQLPILVWVGIGLFSLMVIFQIVNLPVEFNASTRAKALLVDLGIVDRAAMGSVNKVLNAAALTYVAATLQAILTLLYYVMRFAGNSRD